MAEKYLTTVEVAEMARTAPSTVRFWRSVGRGPAGRKVGRRVLYAQSVVEKWLAGEDQDKASA